MIDISLAYIGSVAITIWGVAHIVPTRSVVAGFGELSDDNRRILIMEWVAEGLALCFVGVFAFLVAIFLGTDGFGAKLIYRALGAFLLLMAFWTLITGARTANAVFRICPIVKGSVAVLFFIASAI